MARNEHKRQKALAKKRKRTKEIRKERNRANNVSLTDFLQQLMRGAWHACLEKSSSGMTVITCIRSLSSGLGACVFLVDESCLGVKDIVVVRNVDSEVMRERQRAHGDVEVEPSYAYKKILASIAWSRQIGFEPHPTTSAALQVFQGVDPELCKEEFSFGHPRDGKPFYMQGPHDSPLRITRILETLQKLGHGNFHVMFASMLSEAEPSLAADWMSQLAMMEATQDEDEDYSEDEFDYEVEDEFGADSEDELAENTVDGEVIQSTPRTD